jgi:hypothetical protein
MRAHHDSITDLLVLAVLREEPSYGYALVEQLTAAGREALRDGSRACRSFAGVVETVLPIAASRRRTSASCSMFSIRPRRTPRPSATRTVSAPSAPDGRTPMASLFAAVPLVALLEIRAPEHCT